MSLYNSLEGRYALEDFMTLPDLLLRWPTDPHFKLARCIRNRAIHAYHIAEIYIDQNLNIELELSDITEDLVINVRHFMDASWRILFNKDEILSIERQNPDYEKKQLIKKSSHHGLCCYNNIEQISALAIYLICKFNFQKSDKPLTDIEMRLATLKKEESSECPSGPVESWRIPQKDLWKLYNKIIPRKCAGKVSYNIQKIADFADRLLEGGDTDLIDAVKNIYLAYPKLTSAQLGEVFPHDKTAPPKHSGKQTRGKQLKKRLFERYPDLKPIISSLQRNAPGGYD